MDLKKKRIAITIPSLGIGGAERMVNLLVKSIDLKTFDVFLIVIKKPVKSVFEEELQSVLKEKVFFIGKKEGYSFKAVLKTFKVLRDIKPDVIHTHLRSLLYVYLYVLTHRINVLHTIHNDPEKEGRGIQKSVIKSLIKRKKLIPIGISDSISKKIRTMYHINFGETVYNPVDFSSIQQFNKKKMSTENLTFLNVGRLVEQKNQKVLIEAFVEYNKDKQNHLIILGDGEKREELQNTIERLNAKSEVFLLGNKDNISEYYIKSDVFVLSSLYEGLPMSMLEAMAFGMPVIVTDVGGNRDIFENNGYLIKNPIDKEEYIEAFNKIENQDQRKRFAEFSFRIAAKYSIEKISKEYEELYIKYSK